MAESDSDQVRTNENSDESIRPESKLSERFASSSLLTSLVSSGSLDYYSCEEALEDTPTSEQQLSELSLADPELEDGENHLSAVQIYSVSSSLLPCLIDRCIQIGEHTPDRLCDGVALVIWNPTLCDSFQPASHTSTLPKWWRSPTCYTYFGNVAYMKLSPSNAIRGSFIHSHVDSDDMEGQLKWDPLAPEMSWHRQQRLDHARA